MVLYVIFTAYFPAGEKKLRLKVNLKIIVKITDEKFDKCYRHTLYISASIRQILRKKILWSTNIYYAPQTLASHKEEKKNKTKESSGLCPTLDRRSDVRYLLFFWREYGGRSCPIEWTQEHLRFFSWLTITNGLKCHLKAMECKTWKYNIKSTTKTVRRCLNKRWNNVNSCNLFLRHRSVNYVDVCSLKSVNNLNSLARRLKIM